jgi:phenylpropionate dioxygenase-like ring-hydroxylating dioxygenase large terminal subunit
MYPFYLCMSSDLEEGKYKVFESLGLIATKINGKTVVAENVCSHLGSRVAKCSGTLPLHCKFHGVRFSFERQLISTNGQFIFVNDTQFEEHSIPTFDAVEFGNYEMIIEAPLHLWAKNTVDFNHLKTVHPVFSKRFEGKPYDVDISTDKSSHKIKVCKEMADRFESKNDYFEHTLVYPNLSMTSFLGIFHSVESMFKIDETRTIINTRFFVDKSIDLHVGLKRTILANNIEILLEDKEAVEEWFKGDCEKNALLSGDERIMAYNNWRIFG